jgi:PPOX class probable F420-dependent enzyme
MSVPAKLSDKVRAFLEEPRYAVLATLNEDGSIQQTVMWYQLRGDDVMMNTRRGRVKDKNMLRDRRVSLCVEDEYRYVTIAGAITMIEDQTTAQADIKALAVRYNGPEKGEEQARTLFSKQERITILLPLEQVIADGFEDA